MSFPSTMRSHRSNTPSLQSGYRTTTSIRAAAQQTALRGSSMGPSTVPQRSLPSSTDYRARQPAVPITREVESVLREQREMNTRVQLAQRERERELATQKNSAQRGDSRPYSANSIYGQGYTRPTATSTSMTPRAPSTTNQLSAAKTTPVSLESQRHVSTYTTSANTRIPSPQAPSASQQAAVSSTDHPEPPQGFRNMGNTCYQNASMQALLAVPHLIESIEEHYGSSLSSTRMSTSVAKDIVELAKRITSSSLCLSALKSKCTERNEIFNPQEYIRVLLLLLHENVNRIRGKPAYQEMKDVPGEDPAEAARRWWSYHRTRDDSLVYDIFGGQQQSVVECRACGHQSWSFDPVLDLVLSMPSSRISSPQISLLLQWYTGLSKLEGADRYDCAKCKKSQEADRQVTIARWPAVLSLSLARFDRYGRKNSEEVTFDEVLLTAADCSADRGQRQYELFSVVFHTGTTDYGHYYAYVKKAGKWFRCDDSSVREVNFSMVRSEGRGAYILFYRKVQHSTHDQLSMPISPPPPKEKAPSFLLLVGNSGVGKSFIGNALVGDGVFASSHQVGSVTASAQSADMRDPQGKFWRVIDMPGLMEVDSRNLQRNAQEITNAFNSASGQPVVFAFVLTLEGGRMRDEQMVTIKIIQDSVRGLSPDNTVIIVNKVEDDEPEEEVRGIIRRFFPNHKHVSVMKYFPDNVRRNLSHSAVQNGVAGVHGALRDCTAATIQAQAIQVQTAEAERQRREKALQDEADRHKRAEQEAAERREAERLQQIWLAKERAADVQRQAAFEKKLEEEKVKEERARFARVAAEKIRVEEQIRKARQRHEEEQRHDAEQKAKRQRQLEQVKRDLEAKRQAEQKDQMHVRWQQAEEGRQAAQRELAEQWRFEAAQRERQEAAQRREAAQREVDYRYREHRTAGYNMDGSADMRYSSHRVEGFNKDGSKDMRYKRNR